MYVCMCFYYGLFTTGVKAPVPEGTTDWRCACKGVPDMHLAFVLTKFSQFRGKKNALYLSVNVFSTKVLIGDTIFYVSYWRRDHHFTWSSEPREGLAACSTKVVPSFLWSGPGNRTHDLTLCSHTLYRLS